jgi:signal transduction histidine kinase
MFGSIQWKLSVTYLIVASFSLVFIGVHLSQDFDATYKRRVMADLLTYARVVALHAFEGLSTADPAEVRLHLQGVPYRAGDPHITVTDASGTIVGVRGIPGSMLGTHDIDVAVRDALRGQEVTGASNTGGASIVSAAVPVRTASGGRVFGVVYVSVPLTLLDTELRHIRWLIAGSCVAAFALAAILGLVLARGIAGPIQEMQRVAGNLAAGRLDRRISIRSRDELGALARSLNHMAGELERIDVARRMFVADAAHELRTPVANLAIAVEALKAVASRNGANDPPAIVADLERETQRLTSLVEHLLDLSLIEAGEVRLNVAAVSPDDVILRAVHPFEIRAAHAGITLTTDVQKSLSPIKGDADRIVQVLTGLIDNALKITPAGGHVTVSAGGQAERVILTVTDTGPGIPAAALPHLFDRFYRVDAARTRSRGGAGLGLAIAKRLVEAQGGTIMVESEEGRGARFIVVLPTA